MLKITLYKNCILNETYKNVISTGLKNNISILDRYLNGLTKIVIPDVDYAYQQTKGRLIFDYDISNNDNIFEYNYMKVECFTDEEVETLLFVRYCFIQDIILNNQIVFVDYSEDIWSSYSKGINNTTNSYITNSRILSFPNNFNFNYYKLPIEYEGNNKLTFSKLTSVTSQTDYVKAIIQIQWYNLSQQGVRTGRQTAFFYVNLPSNNTVPAFINNITWIIKLQTEKKFYIRSNYSEDEQTYTQEEFYYDIGKIYIVPNDFLPSSLVINGLSQRFFIDLTSLTGNLIEFNYLVNRYEDEVKEYTITHSFKNLFVGTFTNFIDIKNNGTNIKLSVLFSHSQDSLSYKINAENNIVDITYDFEYFPSIESLSGEQASQLRISREIASSNATANFVGSTLKNTINTIAGGLKFDYFSQKRGGFGRTVSSAEQMASGSSGFISSTWSYINNMKLINANVYQTTKGVYNNIANINNSYYGLCLFTINSDNDNFVKSSINELGYEVFDFISDLSKISLNNPEHFINNNINYNSIKFDTININGSFPRSVAVILNEILTNGVKIWYNENLQDDNLVVG